jgi:hypothetical protein
MPKCKPNQSAELIKNSPPIFFCEDDSIQIDGIPAGSIVKSVQSLIVIDTIYGFKFPLEDSIRDDILLIPREEAIQEQPNHALLLEAFDKVSEITKKRGVQRGKNRIVSFQEGSNCKYLTPGIYPERASTGTAIRSLDSLQPCHHEAIFHFVATCELLAMRWMSLEVTRGFNCAKKMFPYQTLPGPIQGKNTQVFAAIASACNVCLNSHTDDDAFYSVVTTMEEDPTKQFGIYDEIALYFTFPTLGLAVALRPGDILYFNPTIYHSVSSRRDIKKKFGARPSIPRMALWGGTTTQCPSTTLRRRCLMFTKI